MAVVTAAGQSEPTPLKRLDQAAAAFSANSTDVSGLADAVFAVSHFDDVSIQQMPRPFAALLKSRFVAAEKAYWAAQKPGVSEQNIVDGFEQLRHSTLITGICTDKPGTGSKAQDGNVDEESRLFGDGNSS